MSPGPLLSAFQIGLPGTTAAVLRGGGDSAGDAFASVYPTDRRQQRVTALPRSL